MALRPDEARELIEVAARHGVRLALRARDVPRRGPADRGGVDPRRAPGTDPRRLCGRQPRADRDLAPRAAGVLRRRRAGRRRRLPADAGHDDGRAGAVRAGVGLGPAAGPRDGRRDAVPHRPARPDRRGDRARRRGGAAADGLVLRRPAGQVPRRPRVPWRRRLVRAGQLPGVQRLGRGWTVRRRLRGRPLGPRAVCRHRLGRAGSRTSPRRSPKTGPIARRPSRPPTSSTSSTRRRVPWRPRAARSRWPRRSRRLR